VSAITTPLAPSDSFSLCRPSQCVPEAASDTTACRVTHAVRRLLQELVQRARRRTWHAGVRYRALLSRQGVHTSETPPLACPLQSSQSVKALPSLPHDL
jgi:hypothetical protein